MFTFFKNIIKAIVVTALIVGVVNAAFIPAMYIFVNVSSNAAALWVVFYLVVFIAGLITLSQENEFSKRAEKECRAFWNW